MVTQRLRSRCLSTKGAPFSQLKRSVLVVCRWRNSDRIERKELFVKSEPRSFHFLGICGTAMGSIAAALKERGFHRYRFGRKRLSADVDFPRATGD